MRRLFTLATLLCSITLSACGTRGALYLPPLPGQATPAPANPGTPTPAPDLNTVNRPAS